MRLVRVGNRTLVVDDEGGVVDGLQDGLVPAESVLPALVCRDVPGDPDDTLNDPLRRQRCEAVLDDCVAVTGKLHLRLGPELVAVAVEQLPKRVAVRAVLAGVVD